MRRDEWVVLRAVRTADDSDVGLGGSGKRTCSGMKIVVTYGGCRILMIYLFGYAQKVNT